MKRFFPIIFGLALGGLSKAADFIPDNSLLQRMTGAHDLFNSFSLYVMIICIIEIYSKSIQKAMIDTLLLVMSMVISYYCVQGILFHYFPLRIFILWLLVSLFCPFLCYIVHLRRKESYLYLLGTLTPLIIIAKEIEPAINLLAISYLHLLYKIIFILFLIVKLPMKNTHRTITLAAFAVMFPFISKVPSIYKVLSVIFYPIIS